MNLPEYVSKNEVKRICNELKIRDWTTLSKSEVLIEEAKTILSSINAADLKISAEDFRQGLEVELEHGTRYPDANVTNNHPILTGKIVLAHLKESLDYYKRLEVAELEGDLLKDLIASNLDKIIEVHKKLADAKLILNQHESKQMQGPKTYHH